MKGYTKLRALLHEEGISFHDTGPSEDHLGGQVMLVIEDEQGASGVYIYYNIVMDGTETFVCQE